MCDVGSDTVGLRRIFQNGHDAFSYLLNRHRQHRGRPAGYQQTEGTNHPTKLGKVTANRHFAHVATSNVNACAFLHDQDPKAASSAACAQRCQSRRRGASGLGVLLVLAGLIRTLPATVSTLEAFAGAGGGDRLNWSGRDVTAENLVLKELGAFGVSVPGAPDGLEAS